ncbi:ROK family protein [Pelagibacteraceae bacterium]|nr:ROK family protein [Pelagibacteraceae bacterium]
MKFKKKYIVVVDLGGTKTNIGYFSNGKLIKVLNFPTIKYGPDNIESISKILITSKKNITAICLSLTGLIDSKGLWNPINRVTLGDFKDYPVIKILKKIFNIPVYALGDTQAAALGEMYYGNGKSLESFFYLTVSTGIGGSIIHNRNLFDGKLSDIGSIGHSVIKYNGRVCGCGKKGCLEAYASGNALIKKNKIKKCKNTKDLLTKFKNNSQTKKIVIEAASMIVQSILNVHVLIRMNYFLIGGSVGLNPYFYKIIVDKLKNTQSSVKIKKAKLKSKAELYGCFVYINKKLFLKK